MGLADVAVGISDRSVACFAGDSTATSQPGSSLGEVRGRAVGSGLGYGYVSSGASRFWFLGPCPPPPAVSPPLPSPAFWERGGGRGVGRGLHADYIWLFPFIKVALNSIPNRLFELFPGVCFGEDRRSQCLSCVSAFRCIFYEEDNFFRHLFASFLIILQAPHPLAAPAPSSMISRNMPAFSNSQPFYSVLQCPHVVMSMFAPRSTLASWPPSTVYHVSTPLATQKSHPRG